MHKKIILWIIVFLAGVLFYSCNRKSPEELSKAKPVAEVYKNAGIPETSKDGQPEIKLAEIGEEQKILSFDMTGYTKEGRKKWEIMGQSADIVAETVMLNSIEANAYSEDRTVVLKANRGRYDKKKNTVKLEGNVIVTTSDGVKLTAEWFEWNSQTNEITTDSFVEVEKDKLYASGYGASASTEEKEVQLNKDIEVKQGEMAISCGGPLMIDYKNNKASFYDMVQVTDPRGMLLADRLDIFFNSDSREIEEAIAEGNVELKRDENIAKGQRIIYTIASGEAILTGNPEILIYSKKDLGDALTGD